MGSGFETGSDNEKIDELQRQLDVINDSQIDAVGGNDNISIDSTRGSRNNAGGDSGGVRSNEPITHQITDVDEGGSPTGFFDKINIISSMAIIDHTSTPITLRFIQGTVKDGARIKITPKIGKTIDVESGGNILTSSTITITDADYYELVKYSEAETGVTGGAFKIFLTGAGGDVSFPIRPPIDDRGVVTTNQTFILSNTTGHILKLELGASIDIIFNNFPIIDVQQEWEVEIIQDGTTPFVITWPASVVNPPDPSSYETLGSTTIVVFRTNDAGTTIRVGNTVSTTGGGGTSFIGFTADDDLRMGTFDITELDRLLYDQAAGQSLIATDVGTTSNANGDLLSNVIAGGFHTFKSALVDIAQFDDTTGLKMLGTHVINMNNNIINTIKELQLETTNTHVPTVQTGIGFDSVTGSLIHNVGLTSFFHSFKAAGLNSLKKFLSVRISLLSIIFSICD